MNGLGRLLLVQHGGITNHHGCFEHVDIHAKHPVPATGTPPLMLSKIQPSAITVRMPQIILYDHFAGHKVVSGGYGQQYAGSLE